MLLMNGLVGDFTFAARLKGRTEPLSTLFYLPPNPNVVYSAALMSKAEEMFLTGKAALPDRAHAADDGPGSRRLPITHRRRKTPRNPASRHHLPGPPRVLVLAKLNVGLGNPHQLQQWPYAAVYYSRVDRFYNWSVRFALRDLVAQRLRGVGCRSFNSTEI